jgi:taurine dioxygenase
MEITPLSDVLGAEVTGVDVSALDDDGFAQVRDAFLTHHMLVFRDQALPVTSQAAFSNRFGELEVHIQKESAHPDRPEVQVLSTKKVDGKYVGSPSAGDNWHTDLQYTDIPTLCTLLYAVETPEQGGDTEWANMYLAYETLPEEIKERLVGLKARHSFNRFRNKRVEVPEVYKGQEQKRYVDVAPPDAIHPVVRTHPESGRKALYVSERFTIGIEGLPEEEGDALLDDLIAHQTQRQFIYRHKWRQHDLTMWDNRCLIHLACGGVPPGQIRHMHRTIVRGDVPY